MTAEIYVVVTEHDGDQSFGGRERHPKGPLVLEQYTDYADLESIKKRAAYMSNRHGEAKVARLEFTDFKFKEGKPA